jgi:hypothetical protein
MRRESWLQRWDHRNQRVLAGEIPEEIRLRWKWDRRQDDDGKELLVVGRVTLSDHGVTTRLFRRRFWPWERVAYLSWEMIRYSASLAVCARGDPYTPALSFGHLDGRACRALLDDCRDFVEAHGARVRSAPEPATMWWVNQPEAQRVTP